MQARDEWQLTFPGAEVVWEDLADEGQGIGFDGVDPSAMARTYLRVDADWSVVLAWYQTRLAAFGWNGVEVRNTWWRWHHPDHPGERIDLLDRSSMPDGWPITPDPSGPLTYEFLFRASNRPGIIPGESSTFDA
jgi:hypothetical protein